MARFKGVAVDEPSSGPRFKGEPVRNVDTGRHLSFEEGERLLEQERLQGRGGELGATLSGAVDGIPVIGPYILSGTQKAAAGVSSLIDGESYAKNLEQAEGATQMARDENPIASTAGSVAGSVLGTAPLVAALPGAFGVGAGSLPLRMLKSGLSGGAIGGADAAVRSDGDLADIRRGVLLGGGLGLAGPFIGDKFSQGYRRWANSRATAEAAKAAGTSKEAVDVVARGLGADNAAGGVNANISAAGGRAMLADAGPSTQSILDTAIQRAGPGAGRASERIAARAAGAADDINHALDTALGTPQGMIRPLEELRTSTQPARAAAYDAAYAQPINYADPRAQTLEKIIRERVPSSIIARANNLMRINGEESQQILASVADDGTVAFEKLPDVRQLDYIKRALNDVSRAGDGNGALGGNTAEGAAYGNLAKTIRDALGALVPEYNTAMKTAAEPIAQREAALFGQRMLSPSVARDEVEAFVSGLSDAELRSLRGGVRSKMDEALANVKRAVTDGNIDARQGIAALRDLSSDAARQKIGTILSPQAADKFIKSVDQAAKSFELRASVTGNSRTYARQSAERAVEQATKPGILEMAGSGQPVNSVQGFLSRLLGADEAAQLARQDATWADIADLLTIPATQGGGSFMQAMQGVAGRLPVIDQQAARIADSVTRGVALSSSPLQRLTQSR